MVKRNFEKWLGTMLPGIQTRNYYVNFSKVYANVSRIKIELNILNSLIGSGNIEKEFMDVVNLYPNVIKAIPILLAKRESEIMITDIDNSFVFDFNHMNYSVEEYATFMRKSGLFDLLQNHIINNLVDYVMGVEVGMDTNGRKNRTGDCMEDLVESFLQKAGLVKNKTYFKEMNKSDIERMFGIDFGDMGNDGKTEKRFDFVFVGAFEQIYGCECNFYSSSGSKLNETARSYKELTKECENINRFHFIWFTDGVGRNTAKNNLLETFEILPYLYNLNDLKNDCLKQFVDKTEYLKNIKK